MLKSYYTLLKTQDSDLLPCAFCGGEGKWFLISPGSHGYSYGSVGIFCTKCGASGGNPSSCDTHMGVNLSKTGNEWVTRENTEGKEAVTMAWNTRACNCQDGTSKSIDELNE